MPYRILRLFPVAPRAGRPKRRQAIILRGKRRWSSKNRRSASWTGQQSRKVTRRRRRQAPRLLTATNPRHQWASPAVVHW